MCEWDAMRSRKFNWETASNLGATIGTKLGAQETLNLVIGRRSIYRLYEKEKGGNIFCDDMKGIFVFVCKSTKNRFYTMPKTKSHPSVAEFSHQERKPKRAQLKLLPPSSGEHPSSLWLAPHRCCSRCAGHHQCRCLRKLQQHANQGRLKKPKKPERR